MIENYGPIDFEFWTSSKVAAKVTLNPMDSYGWTVQDLSNLIALLELQRSMLADERLDVSVTVASPMQKNGSNEPFILKDEVAQGADIPAKSAQ